MIKSIMKHGEGKCLICLRTLLKVCCLTQSVQVFFNIILTATDHCGVQNVQGSLHFMELSAIII